MSGESHFVEEHIEQAAYLHARGHGWSVIANDLKHPDADRLRRTMFKDPTFRAALDFARDELARECLAESVYTFRNRLRDPEKAFEAAKELMAYADAHAARAHKLALAKTAEDGKTERERLKIAARAQLQKDSQEAQYKVELLRARARVQGGEGLPPTEKERLRRERNQREMDERFHDASRRTAAHLADEANRAKEPVWVWGGQHQVYSGQAPDHTDTPVRLYRDYVNGKPIYWIDPNPVPLVFPADYVPGDPNETEDPLS